MAFSTAGRLSLLAVTLAQLSSAVRDAFNLSSALATSQKGHTGHVCCCRGPKEGSCLMVPGRSGLDSEESSCPRDLGYRPPQDWGLDGHGCPHRSRGGKQGGGPTVTVQIFWQRHGYSCSNTLSTQWGRRQGPERGALEYWDAPLTDAGVHRSQKIGELLSLLIAQQFGSEPLVFCSYLRRAIETALYTFPFSSVHPIPFVGEEGVGEVAANTPTPLARQLELLSQTDTSRLVFDMAWRAYADRETKIASDFLQFLSFLPWAIQQRWSGGERSGGKLPSSDVVIPVVIVSHGWIMENNLMCTGHPRNNEVWSQKFTFQWDAWDSRLEPIKGSCDKLFVPGFLPRAPHELCAQDVARCNEGPDGQDWRPSGSLKNDQPVCQGFDAAGASTVVHRDVYYGELYTLHALFKAFRSSVDVASIRIASLTVSLNWHRDGGRQQVERAGTYEQLRHFVSGSECPFYLGPSTIIHGGREFAVSLLPPKTIYVSAAGQAGGWDFNVPVMCRQQAPCTHILGEATSSIYPCSCGAITCHKNEVCSTGWGATVDRCARLTMCTSFDGTELSVEYPCACGSVICAHPYGICNAAKNMCEAPCTNWLQNGLSQIYPCRCAGDVCGTNEVCDPRGASQKCKLLPCTETAGDKMSVRYPCACGASTCNKMVYTVHTSGSTITSYGVCNRNATAPAVNGRGACSACADAENGRTDAQHKGCAGYFGAENSKRCGLFDTDDFFASAMCCACGGGAKPCGYKHGTRANPDYPCVCNAAVCIQDGGSRTYGKCNWEQSKCSPACRDTDIDIEEAEDEDGDGCQEYFEQPSSCGELDTDDFSSNDMCCACGGGEDDTEFAGGFGGEVAEPEPMEVVETEDQGQPPPGPMEVVDRRLKPLGEGAARTKRRRSSKGEGESRQTTKKRRVKARQAFFVVKAAGAIMYESAESLGEVGTLKMGARVQRSAVEIQFDDDVVVQPIQLTGAVDQKSLGWQAEEAPATTLSQAVQARDTVLVVTSQEGFSVGGRVVISGGGNSETCTIASFGSIVLMEPLQHGYPDGSTVTKGVLVVISNSTVYVSHDSRSHTWNAIGELKSGARVQQAAAPIRRSDDDDHGLVMQTILVNGAVEKNSLEEASVTGRPAGGRRAGVGEAGGPDRVPRKFRRRGGRPYQARHGRTESRLGLLETSDVEEQDGG